MRSLAHSMLLPASYVLPSIEPTCGEEPQQRDMTRLAYGLATMFLVLAPHVAQAQDITVTRRGSGDVFIDDRIDRMLRRGNYVPIRAASTTISAGETIPNNVVVLGGDFYLDGTIEGDLVGIDANLYIRPGSRITGDLVNVGGGLYRSEMVEPEGRVRSLPNLPYEVHDESGGRVVIVSHERRRALDLDGAFGFRIPEYNRVDGLHPRFGFTWTARPFLAGFAPGVRGQVGFRTEPGEVTGGGSAFLERGGFAIEGGWLRETHSQDRWIRSDTRNSADFLLDGDDMRHYYGADVAFGEVRYTVGDPETDRAVTAGVRYQDEAAESLREHNPWTVFGEDTLRFNPAITDGSIRGFLPFVQADWLTQRTATDARVELEFGEFTADDDPIDCVPIVDCPGPEDRFSRLRIDSEFAMQALADHTLEIELQFMLPVGGDEPLPRQRFGMLGGSSTIRTVDDAAFYGDHLAYSETEYIIPLRLIPLPRDIVPEFQLLHMAGRAWTGEREDDEDFVQNIGARINVWALYARFLMDPESGDQELTAGVSWPFDDKYAWQE